MYNKHKTDETGVEDFGLFCEKKELTSLQKQRYLHKTPAKTFCDE